MSLVLVAFAGQVGTLSAADVTLEITKPLRIQNLLESERIPEDSGRYVAFPAVVRLPTGDHLVSYKRGRSHANDPGASLEAIHLDATTSLVEWRRTLGGTHDRIFQMGEWVTFADGRIASFVDVQQVVNEGNRSQNRRTGIQWCWSDDHGRSFSAMQELGPIEGTTYGYLFDSATVGQATFVLAMTFPELTPGASLVNGAGQRIRGTVHVLSTSNGGRSWQHVRNPSLEFGGIPINESAVLHEQSGGFIVVTRGYDDACRIHRVDSQWKLQHERNLTAEVSSIERYVGRPRLFSRDGKLYLLGRNFRGGRMELALIRLNPASLAVELVRVLDPETNVQVKDGYYALPVFRAADDGFRFDVITYRLLAGQTWPELLRLEYDWNDVR